MGMKTAVETRKKGHIAPVNSMLRHTAVRPVPEHETLFGLQAPSMKRDFSRVRPQTIDDTCHTCLVQMQTKLTINKPGDKYEQEADRIADQIMRMPDPKTRPEEETTERIQTTPLSVQRQAMSQTAPMIARSIVHEVLNSPGRTLDPATRAFMEPRFGRDFSQVRVHKNNRAGESALAMSARAYAVGHNIVFGSRYYQPVSGTGKRLIAHELTHILQQTTNSNNRSHLEIGEIGDADEHKEKPIHKPSFNTQTLPLFDVVQQLESSPRTIHRLYDEAEAARLLTEATALNPASRTAVRAGWRHFWRVVVKRFALRGATAAGLAAVDGPLPIGDLIAIGLTIWLVYDIISLWDQLWQEAQHEAEIEPESEASPLPESTTDSISDEDIDEDESDRCQHEAPDAIPIRWPQPLWHLAGIDDPGSDDATFDIPHESILVKIGSALYNDNRPEIGRYRTHISNPPFNLTIPTGWPIHHKWPLYLGGPGDRQLAEGEYDAEGNILFSPNLVVMEPSAHSDWHRLLREQPWSPYLGPGPETPDGQRYCIVD